MILLNNDQKIERAPYLFVSPFQYLVLLAIQAPDCSSCVIHPFLTALLHVLYSQQGNILHVLGATEQYGFPRAGGV